MQGIEQLRNLRDAGIWGFSGLDYSDLRAVFVDCTIEKSPATSLTRGLIETSRAILLAYGVAVEVVRPVDHDIALHRLSGAAPGSGGSDAGSELATRIASADILIIASPIWLGDATSVCREVLDDLQEDAATRSWDSRCRRAAGCLLRGKEASAQRCAENILLSLRRAGYMLAPKPHSVLVEQQAWGCLDYGLGFAGQESELAQRDAALMTWSLMHLARVAQDTGDIPARRNPRSDWEAECIAVRACASYR